MKSLFQFLDGAAWVYWVGVVLSTTVLFWQLRAVRSDSARPRWWSLLVCWAGVLLAWRWPELLTARGGSEHEGRAIVGTLQVAADWVEGLGLLVAGAQPLTSVALWPVRALGLPLDYFFARGLAWGLDVATLGFLACGLARGADRVTVARALAPVATLLAVAGAGGWAAYGPAHVLGMLAAVAFALARRGAMPAAACVVGLMPWVGPIGWFGWLAGVVWLAVSRRSREVGMALFGAVLLASLARGTGQFTPWLTETARTWRQEDLGWTLAAAAAVAVWLAGVVARKGSDSGRLRLAIAAVGAVVFFGGVRGAPPMLGNLAEAWRSPRGELAQNVERALPPGAEVAIWGRADEFWVETGRTPRFARRNERVNLPGDQLDAGQRWGEFVWHKRPVAVLDASNRGGAILLNDARAGEVIRELYRRAGEWQGVTLYLRADLVAERARSRPGAVPVQLAGLRVERQFTPIEEGWAGRIASHAPSRLVHRVPPGMRTLNGVVGFLPSAFRSPQQSTDGAAFVVELLRRDGSSVTAWRREMRPVAVGGDREAQEFAVEFGAEVVAVALQVEPGGSNSFDWTYWGELRFEP